MSSAQDAGDSTRLLEAPGPLVLMVVVVPSWRWRQRRETGIALGAILARLISPSPLARLVLPAILARSVTPLLARASAVPSSSTSCSASAVAPIVALGAPTDTAFSHGPKLLAFVGVVGMQVVEGAEWSAALG